LANLYGWSSFDIENSVDLNVVIAPPGIITKLNVRPKNTRTDNLRPHTACHDGLPSLEGERKLLFVLSFIISFHFQGKQFSRARDEQTSRLLELYEERLQVKGVPVNWSKKLNKTAGQTRLLTTPNAGRSASIELATKVVDTTQVCCF
jgi:hypothetical protein